MADIIENSRISNPCPIGPLEDLKGITKGYKRFGIANQSLPNTQDKYVHDKNVQDSEIWDRFKDQYNLLCKFLPNVCSNEPFFEILIKRLKSNYLIRDAFSIILYNFVKEELQGIQELNAKEHEVIIPFIKEVLISVLYYDNQIFDQKGGVNNHRMRVNNLSAGRILYDGLVMYIRKHPDLAENTSLREGLLDMVQDINIHVNISQKYEQEYNHFDSWITSEVKGIRNIPCLEEYDIYIAIRLVHKNCIDMVPALKSKSAFLLNYIKRVFLLNAYYFRRYVLLFVGDLDRYSETQQKKALDILKFASLFGIMLQIVNDNADLVPSSEEQVTHTKKIEDALSDLRNNNITLPLMIHLLKSTDDNIIKFLTGKFPWPEKDALFSKDAVESHAIYESLSIGKSIRSECLNVLNSKNLFYPDLVKLTNIALNNKYYKYFYSDKSNKKIYAVYKKNKKMIQTLTQNQLFLQFPCEIVVA